ncbi:uncharacterized protein LOC135397436 [Ornithodoros turicata]|uniref:uncharacterized protein LOC135397436 n=1 Tax=Ornithodoros turicata TaxID=34597 RepID=UPI0031399480
MKQAGLTINPRKVQLAPPRISLLGYMVDGGAISPSDDKLKAIMDQLHRDWDLRLAELAFATRTTVNRSTGFTPAFLNFGGEAPFPVENALRLRDGSTRPLYRFAEDLRSRLDVAARTARENLDVERLDQARQYNRGRRNLTYSVGELVLRRTHPQVMPHAALQLRSQIGGMAPSRRRNGASTYLGPEDLPPPRPRGRRSRWSASSSRPGPGSRSPTFQSQQFASPQATHVAATISIARTCMSQQAKRSGDGQFRRPVPNHQAQL